MKVTTRKESDGREYLIFIEYGNGGYYTQTPMKHCKHKDNCKFPKCNCSTDKTAGI